MKKILLKFADNALSKSELKDMKGGMAPKECPASGCGCKVWPATVGCHCTDSHWWGDSQGPKC